MKSTSKTGFTRRGLLKSAGATAGMACAGNLFQISPAHAQDSFAVTLQLGWLASNGIIGEVAADKLGYYADEGLTLKVMPGGPQIDGVASVASGRANLGSISSSPSLMLARSAGIPVKCIAVGYQQHPFTYFSLKSNPVNKPEDLIGKKVATNGLARVLLQALLAENGMSEDDIELSVMGADMTPLMTGQVDVVTGWNTNTSALEILGDQRVDMTLWDAGVKLYANPYYVTDETLANYRPQVDAMIRAGSKGWGWVYDNREEAVDFLVERYPNLDRDNEMAAVDLAMDYSFDEKTAANGWGTMDPATWQKQIDIYSSLNQFAQDPPKVDDIMTMSVLETTAEARPKLGG
ncbi:ABC transporter substrate-binding protein [Primorskyibacter flagellatus]|uniref:Thiamine pyrimidine synthase n=1 Tax=Primorskyibacter flagellatus TaxID=1387277 RepID=A0A1W2CCS2_9RHOB|nr:ABC transporter substrate-binding protein [Primorskyibacter flagellatus]SMC82794.1 NitT/TauT family transport system substrate-binding protein [Primorskyibacter flagellatus]